MYKRQLLHQLLGKDPLAGRDDLAELDVGGSEVLERRPEPSRKSGARLWRAPLLGPPDEEREPESPRDGQDPSERRQVLGVDEDPGQVRGLAAQGVDVRFVRHAEAPWHGIGVDDPRSAGGEGTECEVGRACWRWSGVRGDWVDHGVPTLEARAPRAGAAAIDRRSDPPRRGR